MFCQTSFAVIFSNLRPMMRMHPSSYPRFIAKQIHEDRQATEGKPGAGWRIIIEPIGSMVMMRTTKILPMLCVVAMILMSVAMGHAFT